MWYYYAPRHKRSFWKKHGLDILTAVAIFLTLYFPILILFTR